VRKFASDGCSAELEYFGKRHAGHLDAGGVGGAGMGSREGAETKWCRMSLEPASGRLVEEAEPAADEEVAVNCTL
jgi:hypothetical protein